MIVEHNKIVRDGIPAVIEATGRRAVVRQLDREDARAALVDKLAEEGHELRRAGADQVAYELADLLEVVRALAAEYDVPWTDVVAVADRKAAERGAFAARLFLERVEPGTG